MLKSLPLILEIQELDVQMIQLLRLRQQRMKELANINAIKTDLKKQTLIKEGEILELKKIIRINEGELEEILTKQKRLESQQSAVKKMEEFNALTHELTAANREKLGKEQKLSDLYDKLAVEEDILKSLRDSLSSTVENSKAVEEELYESISKINEEGRGIKASRDKLVEQADPEVFGIYERLLRNKKDRVVVPIENRCCSGCHIMITAQDENLVRKGERLVFCEHCSRIHYWQESEILEGTAVATKRRRRSTSRAA